MENTTLFNYYYIFLGLVGLYTILISLSNIIYFKVRTKKPTTTEGPLLSVLIPARNEEDNIGKCLDTLLDQTYKNYEIIVLDDQSDDRTWEILQDYADKYDFIRIVQGKPLPDDWNGKTYAMQQLSEYANGEYYLFTDADTRHKPTSLSWVMTNMLHHDIDMLSGYAHHTTESIGERIVVPNMYLNTALFLPLWLIPGNQIPAFAHAIGQYITFKASTYKEMGGYSCIKQKITEDVYISREMKRRGYKIDFLDAKNALDCRMYSGFKESVNGISKNIYDFFEKKLYPIVLLSIFILVMFIMPVALLPINIAIHSTYLIPNLIGVGLFLFGWVATLRNRNMKWYTPFMYPLLFGCIIYVAYKSFIDDKFGDGYIWKGRYVK